MKYITNIHYKIIKLNIIKYYYKALVIYLIILYISNNITCTYILYMK